MQKRYRESTMKLRILGCSGGVGGELRTTSFLLDDDILIDAGTGISELTLEEMAGIRHVFLTHTHLDHIACLPLMVDSMFPLLKEPLVIHAQQSTIDVLKEHIFNWHIWPDFATLPTEHNPVMRYEPLAPGECCRIGGRSFEMIPVNHIVPTVGYRIEAPGGGVLAFSGDTTTNDSFWAALNAHERLDHLIVEAAFDDGLEELSRRSRHYCPSLLAADLRKLRHNPRIYISHNKPASENTIFEQCRAAMPERSLTRLHAGMILEI